MTAIPSSFDLLETPLNRKLERLGRYGRYLASSSASALYIGWLGYRNLGDEILLAAIRECLAPLDIQAPPLTSTPLMRWLYRRKRHKLAILGGGTLIGERSPIEWLKHGLAVSGAGVVVGAGATPSTEGPVPQWLEEWGAVLRPLPYVGVRGPETAATLARVGVAAEILGDPVCWFGQPREFWQPTEKVMGLNVGHSYGHMYGAEAEIQKKLADFARTMRQRGWTIEFYCVWPDDLGVIHRVAAEAGIANPVIHCIYDDARAYLERVRRLQFFVGIKLHAVALAMCANTPSVMLEYRPKCREFMSSLGMERFAFRSDRFAVEDLLAAADEFEHRSGAIADAIVSGMAPIRSRLQGLGDRIAKLESTNA